MKEILVNFKTTKAVLCVALYSIEANELKHRSTLVCKYEVVSNWRDRRKRIYLYMERYPILLDTLFVNEHNRWWLSACCLFLWNEFGQRDASPVLHANGHNTRRAH